MRHKKILLFAAVFLLASVFAGRVWAANNSTFNQTINTGTLATDIQDASHNSVASPSVTMSAKTFSFDCLSGGSASTGSFGTSGERIYVTNPDAADSGWTLALAATSGATATWSAGTPTMDFNDAGGSGCTDGADTDTKGGQLTVDPSVGTLTADCASCTTANVTKGSSTAYVEGTTNSVTLLNAAALSDDVWRGYLTGVSLSQTIPAEQATGTYTLNMTLTVTAS
ncbi:MAG: hypothetical protein ACREGJ_03905 [Candidatus Saccharimonadales bacterium]